MIDYKTILSEIKKESAIINSGELPTYIPQLAEIDPLKFGIHLQLVNGETYAIGDSNEKFSIQSISKVLSLSLAFSLVGESIWERVGVEPSGNPFNSIIQLEYESGIPRNPFINAGAIVIADILVSELKQPKSDFLKYIHSLAGNPHILSNELVAASEKECGFLNASLINMLKSYGNIKNNIEEVLDFYYFQCAIEMTCKELSKVFIPFASVEVPFKFGDFMLSKSQVKRINAVMLSCGFYDESGEFAFKVGLPGKSGVGGGIIAVHPGRYSVAVWSPKLNEKGNSYKGMKALELLTTKSGISIF